MFINTLYKTVSGFSLEMFGSHVYYAHYINISLIKPYLLLAG